MGEELSEDDNYNGYRPSLGQSTHKMLEKMRDKIGMAPKLMNESTLKDEELEFELMEETDD